MPRNTISRFAIAVFAFAMALPVLAAPPAPKGTEKPIRSMITLTSPVMVSGHELKAGDYEVSAFGDKVTISQYGKTVAEAPAQWKDAPKPRTSTIVLDANNTIKEIHFGGKDHYVELE
jgi:hypothetical protein